MWKNLNSVYFVGIGGIGMSALARYFRHRGKYVAGYDRTSTSLTDQLTREGIDIHFIDKPILIPDEFKDPERTLVIYTPAIPETNNELNFFRDKGFHVIKRSVALGDVFNAAHGIAVAGTHGKTSVSSMVAHLLNTAGKGCNAFLGGIAKNFESNILIHPTSEIVIAEADEYDRSFLALYPELAVVTSMDADHLDIYGSEENLKRGFESFVAQIKDEGKLILKHGLELEVPSTVEVFTYALENKEADYVAFNIKEEQGLYSFSVKTPRNILETSLGVPGMINVENMLAAIAVADQTRISLDRIAAASRNFVGVKRRFDVQVMKESRVYIDDYAHHPEELKAFISSVRKLFPGRKLTGIFQPHLFSRTQDFADGFGESLSLLDELILLDIYPAREEPIEGVSSEMILDRVRIQEKTWIKKEQLYRVLEERRPDVLLTMGAGDIDRLVEPLKQWMEGKR